METEKNATNAIRERTEQATIVTIRGRGRKNRLVENGNLIQLHSNLRIGRFFFYFLRRALPSTTIESFTIGRGNGGLLQHHYSPHGRRLLSTGHF